MLETMVFGDHSFVGVPSYTNKVVIQSVSLSLASPSDLPVLTSIEGSSDTFSNCQFFVLKRRVSFSSFP